MTVQPHPVAALLTPEMRARVAAATFVTHKHQVWRTRTLAKVRGRWCCPLAVAAGVSGSVGPFDVLYAIDGSRSRRLHEKSLCRAIQSFITLVDDNQVRPEDVKPLLGCADEAP